VSSAERQLAETIRAEGARILATLVRIVGDLHIAEDAVQDAAMRALRQWPVTGIPDSPRAWLTVTARRAAIDVLRREGARNAKERAAVDLCFGDEPPEPVVQDDMLRLVLTCAHPAPSLQAHVPPPAACGEGARYSRSRILARVRRTATHTSALADQRQPPPASRLATKN